MERALTPRPPNVPLASVSVALKGPQSWTTPYTFKKGVLVLTWWYFLTCLRVVGWSVFHRSHFGPKMEVEGLIAHAGESFLEEVAKKARQVVTT